MSHWTRLIYAVALTAAVSGVVIIVLALVAPDIMSAFITQPYWVAIFVVSYLIAPFIGRYIKRE